MSDLVVQSIPEASVIAIAGGEIMAATDPDFIYLKCSCPSTHDYLQEAILSGRSVQKKETLDQTDYYVDGKLHHSVSMY